MQKLVVSILFLFSFLLRIWGTPRLDFGLDQQAIYQIGKSFFDTGVIPAYGPKLVYTGESIPGGFQALVAGFPLYFSGGDPIGLQIWTGVLNWLSMLMLFFWLRPKVQKKNESLLAFFLTFSPWSLLFSSSWNPSFLPILVVPFFWMFDSILNRNGEWKKREAFFIGLISVLCLQLHLSSVLLGLAVLIAIPVIQKKIRFLAVSFLGVMIGAVFLIPWILEKWKGQANAPTGVVGLYFENLIDYPKTILRYSSFSTSEISRFIAAQGLGFQNMVEVLMNNPLFLIPAVIAFGGSVVMVWIFFRRWVALRGVWNQGFYRLELLLPLVTPLTFLFSVKSASAHTFWILMPLSFYGMVRALDAVLIEKRHKKIAWGYLVCSIVLTLFTFARLSTQTVG